MVRVTRTAMRSVDAVFLDRDGVINENRADHVKSWDEFHFLPGVLDAIARLSSARVRVFIFSNQAIVDRKIVPAETINTINHQMVHEIELRGGRIEAVAWCPHRPEEGCECRKPRPGLLLSLADRHGIDLHASVVIGDALSDVEAGRSVGCLSILVLTGRGRAQLALAEYDAEFLIAADLGAATRLVLKLACE